ncbi:MAG: penicillin-binding protein activator LpoB [bacterium]|nr:penicillin-binding protein activator LpoB [bacterium]
MKPTQALAACTLALFAVGCGSTRYKNAQDEETLNVDWGSTDLQTFSQHMVDSLLESPQLSYLSNPAKGDDQRIVAVMGGVSNETREHISTAGITDSVRASLLQSGKFRFVAGDPGQDEVGKQVRFQQGTGRVDPNLAKAFGRQLGAEVVMYGALRDITKKTGRSFESLGTKKKDVYYQFVLNCVNVETGEIIWSNEEEIRKTQVVGLFGSG